MIAERVAAFFDYSRLRHTAYLKRSAGEPWPWVDDATLNAYRFCNIFRELDTTTIWFRQNVREPMQHEPEVLLATVLFRWFNRIETNEVIFRQKDLEGNTPWDRLLLTGNCDSIVHTVRSVLPGGPWVTGSYMISSPNGVDKLVGITNRVNHFNAGIWRAVAERLLQRPGEYTLRQVWNWLTTTTPGLGKFMAYEVVTDLRHTSLLDRAPDLNAWANVGPGAKRGLNRLMMRARENSAKVKNKYNLSITEKDSLRLMGNLLAMSRDPQYWPSDWPQWEMREVEHTLCEFDKYERAQAGEGTPRQIFRPRK